MIAQNVSCFYTSNLTHFVMHCCRSEHGAELREAHVPAVSHSTIPKFPLLAQHLTLLELCVS